MRLKIIALIMALLILLPICLTGCFMLDRDKAASAEVPDEAESEEDPEYPVEIRGANLHSRPGIVVSLAPSLTEKVRDLGLEDRLEGISDYCDELEGTQAVRCGTAQLPDFDAIEKLSPHLIITEPGLSDDDMETLRQMGIEVAVIDRAGSVGELTDNYLALCSLMEGKKTGAALGEAFNSRLRKRLDSIAQNAPDEPKNAVYLMILDFTMATGDTLESELMGLIGLNNIAKDQKDWEYPAEEANGAEGRESFKSLDFIYCDKRSVTIKMLEQSAFYKGLDVVIKDRYLYIDSSAFERQSLRMLDELERMALYAAGEIPGSKDEEAAES